MSKHTVIELHLQLFKQTIHMKQIQNKSHSTPLSTKDVAMCKRALSCFKGLPVCYVNNEDVYQMYRPVIRQLNRGIVVLCCYEFRDNVECGNEIIVEFNSNCVDVFFMLLQLLEPRGVLVWEQEREKQSPWMTAVKRSKWPILNVSNKHDLILSEQCGILNRKLWELDYTHNKKLQGLNIGCGTNPMPGWINVDLNAKYPQIGYMDAGKPFPFPNGSFSKVFSEHMFEHLPFKTGMQMLREVYRVLATGGEFILSVPTLDFLMRLYSERESELHKQYVKWSISQFDPETQEFYSDEQVPTMFVVNNFMRFWGHQMIYDIDTLKSLLLRVGFQEVICTDVGDVTIGNTSIEQHGSVIPTWANSLEAKTFVALKI